MYVYIYIYLSEHGYPLHEPMDSQCIQKIHQLRRALGLCDLGVRLDSGLEMKVTSYGKNLSVGNQPGIHYIHEKYEDLIFLDIPPGYD